MARLSVLCICVSLYFSLFLRISSVSALNGHHFYETRPDKTADHVLIKLLEDGESHHLHKRQAGENRPAGNGSTNQTAIRNNTLSEINTTTKFNNNAKNLTTVPSVPLKNDTKKVSSPAQAPYIFPTSIARSGTEKDLKLLGVNGTGQRKIYTSTSINPTVITSTYPTLLHDIPRNKSGKPNFDEFLDNISISKFSEKDLNATLAQHNITNETVTENYLYYNSTFMTDPEVAEHYWVNLSEFTNATTHELLSSAHRRAATVALSFDFPFYGHLIKNVTMATGGFLYTGDYVHAWLAATQYIAPLMANFDTSLSNDSFVRYIDNGTAFTVLWEKVSLKDKADAGDFTFQTTLHKNGDIVFVYKHVPLIIENIKDDQHPVKVGLSDAYIIDSTIFFLRRKTIYEYHKVNFQKEDIKNSTVIYLKALPTCLDQSDCESCLTKSTSTFQCVWCPGLKKCSNGVDRHRQAWIIKACDQTKVKNVTQCSRADESVDEGSPQYIHTSNDMDVENSEPSTNSLKRDIVGAKQSSKVGISGVLAVMLLVSMIVGITMWVFYAYRNPHTTSGQMLIRYRPSQWRWRRGEARYTAATIHM